MPDPMVVSMSGDQVAVFTSLDAEEANAKRIVENVPRARSAAAMAVILATVPRARVEGAQLHIDTQAQTITFTPAE